MRKETGKTKSLFLTPVKKPEHDPILVEDMRAKKSFPVRYIADSECMNYIKVSF